MSITQQLTRQQKYILANMQKKLQPTKNENAKRVKT